jgi:aminopeptidase N
LAAGPWGEIKAPTGSTKVPMKLYCVPSTLSLLDAYSEFIFDVTAKSMAFYESYFSELFPFKKYDQIFVRDFAHWAMENAGLVAYN